MLPESVDWIDQSFLLTNLYICTITGLYIHCVRSTGSTLIILVHIGYATRSNSKGATILLYYRVKIAKRGRIDISPKLPKMAPNYAFVQKKTKKWYPSSPPTCLVNFKATPKSRITRPY